MLGQGLGELRKRPDLGSSGSLWEGPHRDWEGSGWGEQPLKRGLDHGWGVLGLWEGMPMSRRRDASPRRGDAQVPAGKCVSRGMGVWVPEKGVSEEGVPEEGVPWEG